MNTPRISLLLCTALLASPALAQPVRPQPAQSAPLRDDSGVVRQQSLSAGRVTGSVDIVVPLGETPVTVRSVAPASVVGQYRMRFAELDVDGDGFISREEAQVNPALADEFNALDVKRRGKLDRADLAGWLVD
ncbi:MULTISPECIES: EF-hand domain-containing protein [Stenotrophomonas]|uniref:EF-hand domain-containing protein n=1 Tax=Stenotrophomonas lactitubi TaxID=2045214 RepID=A0AAW4GKY9_9GAMM|nr:MULTISPECIES: EF-hand domain-containing protein [Stenotrophomonas]MBM9914760.1 EF-hand domain-containing protein [Stenotrophomonas lactitubi]MBM9923810.1 EF-hand domain-containing protein [Stenotrophomonas lactitubi]MBM9939486.1 EF-hand domain-containing protein [Stenotrophomonas lactitubi]